MGTARDGGRVNNLLAAGLFCIFAWAALLAARTSGDAAVRRRTTTAFIGLALVLSFGAGLLQRDFYPFCPWPLVAGVLPDTVGSPRLAAVTDDGMEHRIDYRAWMPLPIDEFNSWIDARFEHLTLDDQRAAAAWLLRHADSARARARAAGGIGELGALGPLSAPFFLQHERLWSSAVAVPARRFVAIRFYRDRWSIRGREHGAPKSHHLFFEYDSRVADNAQRSSR